MKKSLLYNIRTLFSRKELYIAIIAILVMLTIHLAISTNVVLNRWGENTHELLQPYAYHLPLDDQATKFKYIFILFLPLLAGFIFSDSHMFEKVNHIDAIVNVKLYYKHNIYAKLIIIFITTFIVVCTCLLFNTLINYIIYPSNNYSDYFGHHVYNLENVNYSMLEYFRVNYLNMYVLLNIIKFSLFSSLLSVFAFSLSFHVHNKIIVNFSTILLLMLSHIFFSFVQLEHISIISILDVTTRVQINDFLIGLTYLIMIDLILIVTGMRKKMVGL